MTRAERKAWNDAIEAARYVAKAIVKGWHGQDTIWGEVDKELRLIKEDLRRRYTQPKDGQP